LALPNLATLQTPVRCRSSYQERFGQIRLVHFLLMVRKNRHDCRFCLAHLACAAFRAISARCSLLSFAALAGPPFLPPNLPSATAAGFLPSAGTAASGTGSAAGSCATSSTGGLLERLRIPPSYSPCGWKSIPDAGRMGRSPSCRRSPCGTCCQSCCSPCASPLSPWPSGCLRPGLWANQTTPTWLSRSSAKHLRSRVGSTTSAASSPDNP
jgi:hypothetical protein